MFLHFSSPSTSAGAGTSAEATCETAAEADKTHLGERIWCIYSTAVKIPEVSEPLPTPQLWVVQHLPEEKNWEANPANLLSCRSQLQHRAGQDAAGQQWLGQVSCARKCILIAKESLLDLLRALPGGWLSQTQAGCDTELHPTPLGTGRLSPCWPARCPCWPQLQSIKLCMNTKRP